MTDYEQIVKALRWCANTEICTEDINCGYLGKEPFCKDSLMNDAAAAIEELQKVNRELRELYEDAVRKLPNRGEWIAVNPMVDSVQCSICGGQLFSAELETPYCPYCGAKMNNSNASNALNALDNAQDGPIVTPCRGCSDYDGYGGCKSKGGCARARMEVQDADT